MLTLLETCLMTTYLQSKMAPRTGLVAGLAVVLAMGCQLQVESLILDSRPIAEGTMGCTGTGQQILAGVDDNGDGTLTETEIQSQTSVCFPTSPQGSAAALPLVEVTATPQATCTDVVVRLGNDANENGSIDAGEDTRMASSCVPPSTNLTMLDGRFIDAEDPMFSNLTVTPSPNPADPSSFASLPAALDFLRLRRKSGGVTISVAAGNWRLDNPLRLDDLDGISIKIAGPDSVNKPVLEFDGTNGIEILDGHVFGTLENLIIQNTSPGTVARGLMVRAGSRVGLQGVEIRNFFYGLEVVGGHVERPAGNDGEGISVVCNPGDPFSVGIWIRDGGMANLGRSQVSGCTNGLAFWVMNGAFGAFSESTATTSSVGFAAERGSFIEARRTQANGNRTGFLSANHSMIVIEAWRGGSPGTGNQSDIAIRDGSVFRAAEPYEPPITCGNLVCDSTGIYRGCTETFRCGLVRN